MATQAAIDERGTGDFECKKCGRTFIHGAWYTKHALRCDGKPQTRGRIERLEARHGRSLPAVITTKTHATRVHAERTPPAVQPGGIASIAEAATDQAIKVAIVGLRAKRDRLDTAIAALEAVSA